MKHLLLTTALIAAGTAGTAFAEAHATAKAEMTPFVTEATEGQIQASEFIGMRVYAAAESSDMTEIEGADQDWEDIGEINDVLMGRDGQVTAVLVDIGGFLGIGERQIAVNLSDVKFVSDSSTDNADDFFLVLNYDPETLDKAPEFNVEQHSDASMATDAEKTGENVADATATVKAEAEETSAEIAAAADAAGKELEQAGDKMAAAAEATGDKIEQGAENVAAAADATATELKQDMAAAGEEVRAETNEMAAEAKAATDAPMFPGTPVENDYLTTENLDGARVYDANDKWVGEISELIVTEDGQITDAIIDVGGFLGIGEKPVALKLTDLQILRQDGSDDVRIYTAMAEEDLEAMPTFEGK